MQLWPWQAYAIGCRTGSAFAALRFAARIWLVRPVWLWTRLLSVGVFHFVLPDATSPSRSDGDKTPLTPAKRTVDTGSQEEHKQTPLFAKRLRQKTQVDVFVTLEIERDMVAATALASSGIRSDSFFPKTQRSPEAQLPMGVQKGWQRASQVRWLNVLLLCEGSSCPEVASWRDAF